MHRKLLSAALGVGLAVTTVAPAFAQTGGGQGTQAGQTGQVSGQAQARQALQAFCDFTARNWSTMGFSSVTEARQALGNSQSDWLTETTKMAGGFQCGQAAQLTTQPSQPSQGTQPAQGGPGSEGGRGTQGPQGGPGTGSGQPGEEGK
jgi:hypothetical protein